MPQAEMQRCPFCSWKASTTDSMMHHVMKMHMPRLGTTPRGLGTVDEQLKDAGRKPLPK